MKDTTPLVDDGVRTVGSTEMAGALETRGVLCPDSTERAESGDYRDLFERSPLSMWVRDVSTLRFLAVNQAAIDCYGYSREEFLEMTVRDILIPEDVCRFAAGYTACDSAEAAVPSDWRHRTKSGRIFDVELSRSPVTFQGRAAVMVVAKDIAKRRQSEILLKLRYDLSRLMTENSGDIAEAALQLLTESLGYQAAELWLRDPGSGTFHIGSSWEGSGNDVRDSYPIPGSATKADCGTPYVRGCCEPCWTPDAGDHPRGQSQRGRARQPFALLEVPIKADSRVIGALLLFARQQASPPSVVKDALLDVGSLMGQYVARREAEQQSRQAEQEFRTLFEEAPLPYHEIDSRGRIVRVNHAECQLLGFQPSEMIGQPVWRFVSAADREASETAVRAKLRGNVDPRPFERRYTRADGREFVFQMHESVIWSSTGKVAGIRTAMLDLTAMRTAQGRIEFQAGLLDRVKDAVVACDPQYRITFWNPAAERLYGCKAEEVLGKTAPDVVPMELDEAEYRSMEEELYRRGEWSGEIVFRTRDGGRLTIDLSATVLLNAAGQAAGIVGIHRDVTQRKAIEERVRVLSRAVEQSPVSILITDRNGTIEYANSKACETTQYTLDELVGRHPRVFKSGFTAPDQYRTLWETIQSQEWHGVFHNRRKDGSLYWEAATIGPVRDERGTIVHYLAVKEDITERRAMEEALSRSEERFRIAVENSADLVYERDIDQGTIQVFGGNLDPNSELRLCAPKDDLELFRLIHPCDRARLRAAIDRHESLQEPLREEFRFVLPSGSVRHVMVRASLHGGVSGTPRRSIGVLEDVTEVRVAERANAELAAIIESNDAAIISKDLEGTVLTWNPGAERLYGYSATEMAGRDIGVLWGPERAQEESAIRERLRRGEQISHLETVAVSKNGDLIPVLVTISPMRNCRGEIVGASHVAWDLSEQKRLQQQLAQSQKLESIGQLAAGIAHEINTPIQYIGDNAQFLSDAFTDVLKCASPGNPGSEDVDLDYLREEVPAAIVQLSQGVEHVARIVRAMKELSHPGAAELSPADLNRAIESTIVVSRNEWKYVADMEADLDPTLPQVPCIVGEFNQVILNLIVNAAHAIAEAKRAPGRKGTIRISTKHSGDFAEVRVSDTGTGIPQAIQSKIFDPFFTTKPVGKGTGQGLAIAHAVITQKHRGTLQFETREGAGTTFIIRLPLESMEGLR